MSAPFPPLQLQGARVLREGRLVSEAISLNAGQIAEGAGAPVDLSGYLVLPGIVDLGSAALARHGGAGSFNPALTLRALDREAAAAGVTTTWVAQAWSWDDTVAAPAVARAMAERIANADDLLTDIRMELRLELHMVEAAEDVLETVRRYAIDKVVFYDAVTPIIDGRGALRPETRRDLYAQASMLRETVSRLLPRHLCRMAEAFETLGVVFGSYGDTDAESRERFSMFGARLAATPLTRKAAASAGGMGDPVTMPAPDILRKGSAAPRLDTGTALRDGFCTALVSDGYPFALAAAAFALADHSATALAEAWSLISEAPARIMGLSDRGRIAKELRADLAIVNARTQAVEATIANGQIAHLSGEVGRRFLQAMPGLSMAAE